MFAWYGRFGENLDVVLDGLFWKRPQILVIFGIFAVYGFDQGRLGKKKCAFEL